jgi:hypothetical protein
VPGDGLAEGNLMFAVGIRGGHGVNLPRTGKRSRTIPKIIPGGWRLRG